MTQQIINVGNVANDGQGDSLRTAFIKANDNFSELYTSAITIPTIVNGNSNVNVFVNANSNVTVSVRGVANVMVVTPTLVTITGDLAVSGNASLTGNIVGDAIYNGTTSIQIPSSGSNAVVNVGNVANIVVWSVDGQQVSGTQSVTGAVSAGGNVTGANVIAAGQLSAGGSVVGALISSTGNVNTVGIVGTGDFSTTGNVTAGNLVGTLVASSLSISGNITGGNLRTGGVISSTGTITGSSLLGSVVSASGNITGGNILTGGLISSTGNITGGNILGGANVNATLFTGTTVSVTGNITGGNIQGVSGNITGLSALDITTENIYALVGNNGVNISAGGFNNLVVLPTYVVIQNVPLSVVGNVIG